VGRDGVVGWVLDSEGRAAASFGRHVVGPARQQHVLLLALGIATVHGVRHLVRALSRASV